MGVVLTEHEMCSGAKETDGRQPRDLECALAATALACETGESRGHKRPISNDRPSLPPLCGATYRGRSQVGIAF